MKKERVGVGAMLMGLCLLGCCCSTGKMVAEQNGLPNDIVRTQGDGVATPDIDDRSTDRVPIPPDGTPEPPDTGRERPPDVAAETSSDAASETSPDVGPETVPADSAGEAWLDCGHGVVLKVGTGEGTEYRFYRGTQHFLSLIHLESGALVLRPHPSLAELDAWGSSCALMTFLAGADVRGAQAPIIQCTAKGFKVEAEGVIPMGATDEAGSWSWDMEMRYLPEQERVTGSGIYKVNIDSADGIALTDANLYRVTSSFMTDVPLRSGGIGDTGDMSKVEVDGGSFQFTWVPDEQPGFFPSDQTNRLEVEVLGAYNEVDTAAQGYAPIKPAHKPTIRIVLETVDGKPLLSFGAMYDLSAATQFWADNVGVVALRLKPVAGEALELKVSFDSVPEGPVP